MKILNINVAGFRALIKKNYIINNISTRTNNFNNFIEKYNFDILCLQEIKLNDSNLDILDEYFINYEYKYVNIPTKKKGYSGVAIISKYKPLNMIDELIINKNNSSPQGCPSLRNDNEGRIIILEFKKFYLVNVYAPNAGVGLKRLNYKNEFNKSFYKLLNKLKNKKEILIVGDLNCVEGPIGSYNFDKQYNKLADVTYDEIKFFNKLIDNGYNNAFRKLHHNKIQYSYFSYRYPARSKNHGMLIDHVLATDKLLKKIKKIEYMKNIYGSDHLPIIIDLGIDI